MSAAYCVQLKDETSEHKIYPRTLAHCVVNEDGTDILSLMKDLLGDTSLTFNELLQEANQTTVSPTVFSDLISLLSEKHIAVYYSKLEPASTLGSLWYKTDTNELYLKTEVGYRVRDSIDLRDALRAINSNFSLPMITIHIQDREPDGKIGDLWLSSSIKQYHKDISLGTGWHDIKDYHFGRSNILRYTREYDPLKYNKWVDKTQAPSTSTVYQKVGDEFGVQRIDSAHTSICQSVKLEPSTYYCMSAYVKSERASQLATLRAVVDTNCSVIEASNFRQDSVIGTDYQRVYFVFRTYSTCTYMMPRFTSIIDHPYLIYGLQLEKGIEPTDWNPSPLDVIDRVREYSMICQNQRTLYYGLPLVGIEANSLAYNIGESKVSERVGNEWRDITSKSLISSFEYLNANEEYDRLTAYSQTSMPEVREAGDLWLDTDTEKLYQWNAVDEIWSEVTTEIIPTIMNKIRTALKNTSELSGLMDTQLGDMNVTITKVQEAVSEITPEYIVDRVKESAIYTDAETGKTLMDRMKTAESKITADAIVDTVTKSTKYADDLKSKANADEFGTLKEEWNEAKQSITAEAITSTVTSSKKYQDDMAAKNKTYYEATKPTSGMIEGDLWIDTSNGNKLYRYDADASQWRSVQDTTIAAAKAMAEKALSATGEGITTYYGDEDPVEPSEGSLWVRNATGVKGIWRYNGTQWVDLQDDILYDAMQAAGDAQATADGKIKTFIGTGTDQIEETPSVGDLFIDTDDNNRMYRYDGTSWVDIQDKHLDNAVGTLTTNLGTLTERVSTAEQKITDDAIVSTVRTNSSYRKDVHTDRNFVIGSAGPIKLVNGYIEGSSNTYKSLDLSNDLYTASDNGRYLYMSCDVKRTNLSVPSGSSSKQYLGLYIYFHKEDNSSTGYGFPQSLSDAGVSYTDDDWVHLNLGVLDVSKYGAVDLMRLDVAGRGTEVSGTVEVRNIRVGVNGFADWRYAEEELSSVIKQTSDKIEMGVGEIIDYFDEDGNLITGAQLGSSVVIQKDEVRINTPVFDVQIPSENTEDAGSTELTVNKDGVHTQYMTTEDMECPTVLKKYKGNSIFNNVTSFQDIMFNMNDKVLDDDIIINIPAGSTIDEALTIKGITGSGTITVNGDTDINGYFTGTGSFITAGVNIIGCEIKVTFNYLYSNYNEERSLYVYYNDCTTTTTFYKTVTDDFTASYTDTYRQGSTNPWMGRTDSFYQGFTSGKLYGHVWFADANRTRIPAGCEIVSAQLTIQRMSNFGSTSTVPVRIYSSTRKSADGTSTPSLSSTYGSSTIKFGAKAYIDVTSLVNTVIDGGCLVSYNGETAVASGKEYSTNYAKYYGVGTTGVPILTITWKEASQATSGSTFTSDKRQIRDALGLLDAVYPVGSIYMSVNDVNPGSFIGGKWEALQNRFLVGAGNTYAVNATGGASTHQHVAPVIYNGSMFGPFQKWGRSESDKTGSNSRPYVSGTTTTSELSASSSNIMPLTKSASSLPPYLAVYMWKRTE